MQLNDGPAIHDVDLLAELEAFRGKAFFDHKVRDLERRQAERDVIAALPPARRRRLQTAKQVADIKPTQADLKHMHSVLAICGLPYERLPISQRDYSRKQGNMALDITSGTLRDGQGNVHVQPIPFGPKARLVLMHLCSEAIRQKSATIEIADSLTGFVRDMGFSDSGGRKGPLTAFKEQLNALAAASMRISVWEENRLQMRNITPIEQMDLWLPTHPNQRSLWPSTVTFSDAMYKSIQQRAMPLNRHVIKALAGSARKLDLYFWLNWRMYNLDGPLKISWAAIYDQFRGGNTSPRDFKRHFKSDLAEIREILTKLPAELNDYGLTILPVGPDALALPIQKQVPAKKS